MESKGQREPPASGEGSLLLSVSPDPVPFPPSGVTFSFFWKTQGEASRPTPFAYGGQVISDGFRVCSSGGKGSVELYTRENAMTWEATFSPPGKGPAWPRPSGLAGGDGPERAASCSQAPALPPPPRAPASGCLARGLHCRVLEGR